MSLTKVQPLQPGKVDGCPSLSDAGQHLLMAHMRATCCTMAPKSVTQPGQGRAELPTHKRTSGSLRGRLGVAHKKVYRVATSAWHASS